MVEKDASIPLEPEAVLSPSLPLETPDIPRPRLWYEDSSQTFDHLARFSPGPGVHAAFITCGGELWAYTGQLTTEAAAEVAAMTVHDWEEGENGDLARFITLKSNACQYFLYAIRLLGNQILTLIYDSNLPFSRIRSQSNQLAHSLTDSSPNPRPAAPVSEPALPPPAPVEDHLVSTPSPEDLVPGESDLPPQFDDIPSTEIAFPTQSQPVFEPLSSVISNLTYTAVLIPRLPHHLLKGELAELLKRWVPQLSLAFGWNLVDLAIDPGYLEWVMRLSPEVAPARMIAAVRFHTSQRIFTAMTGLAQENPSGDFWAPGFIIISGTGVLPLETLRGFIMQVRGHQSAAEF